MQHTRKALKNPKGLAHSSDGCACSHGIVLHTQRRWHCQQLLACLITKPEFCVSCYELWGCEPWDLREKVQQASASYTCKEKTRLHE